MVQHLHFDLLSRLSTFSSVVENRGGVLWSCRMVMLWWQRMGQENSQLLPLLEQEMIALSYV